MAQLESTLNIPQLMVRSDAHVFTRVPEAKMYFLGLDAHIWQHCHRHRHWILHRSFTCIGIGMDLFGNHSLCCFRLTLVTCKCFLSHLPSFRAHGPSFRERHVRRHDCEVCEKHHLHNTWQRLSRSCVWQGKVLPTRCRQDNCQGKNACPF